LIHAYSLVHDDMPAMDDDDLRRGKPTCHKAYDEATALLVGDALQSLAFGVLAGSQFATRSPARAVAMLRALADAAGSLGMAGGQAIDLDSVGQSLSLDALETMHRHKTGALIRASVRLGALAAAELDTARIGCLEHYATCIGLAFQIRDDILDVEASTETLGKQQGADAALNKPTYPALLGLDASKRRAQDLCAQAAAALQEFDDRADLLRDLADFIVARSN
jgi:farnesyl diphosphate synthase